MLKTQHVAVFLEPISKTPGPDGPRNTGAVAKGGTRNRPTQPIWLSQLVSACAFAVKGRPYAGMSPLASATGV